MKKEQDKEFDDLFKNKLSDPPHDGGYMEDDWDALEQMLDRSSKRPGIIFWLPIISAAAAVLLFLGWFLFKPQVNTVNQQNSQVAAVVGQNHAGTNNVAGNKTTNTQSSTVASSTPVNTAEKVAANAVGKSTQSVPVINNANITHTKTVNNLAHNETAVQNVNKAGIQQVTDNTPIFNNETRPDVTILAAAKTNSLLDADASSRIASNTLEAKDMVRTPYIPDAVKSNKVSTSGFAFAQHPQFALTVIGASELNAVNSLGDSKSGTNVGLLFSAGVFNKITISTGANYSVKPYNTNIDNYHTTYAFKTDPSQIEADCRVLDIPINIDYQLYNKHNNKFSIGTGLSSYIMLHESYNYYYADPTTKGPLAFTPPGTGKYFFGIMNLQATYQRQVNSKMGLTIQPYMKLPLTNIGYSQVRLQTAGVAVGVNWNINSLTKP